MNNKYIIKNCDCILSSGKCNVKSLVYCQDCTDCVLKNIYFICEEAYAYGGKGLCSKIIKMLDIEECE